MKKSHNEGIHTPTTRGKGLKADSLGEAERSKLIIQRNGCHDDVVNESSKSTGMQNTELSHSSLQSVTNVKGNVIGELFKISVTDL